MARQAAHIVLILGVALLAPSASEACASCACGDPTLTLVGVEKPFAGRLRLSTTSQWRSERNGIPGVTELRNDELQVSAGVAYFPTNWLALAAQVPFVQRTLHSVNGSTERSRGLGDIELTARGVLWQDETMRPNHLLSLQGMFRIPNAPTVVGSDGQPVNIDLQTGRGSWTPSVGLAYAYFGRSFSFFTSLRTEVPVGDRFSERQGVTTLLSGTVQSQPLPWLALLAGIDSRYATPDREAGDDVLNTGGGIVFASAGVSVSPITDLLINATVRIPALNLLRGRQEEGITMLIAAAFDLET